MMNKSKKKFLIIFYGEGRKKVEGSGIEGRLL